MDNQQYNNLINQNMAYDLRQIYAKLVGEHLEDIAEARKQNSYYNYFKALEDLHIIVKHQFDKKRKKTDMNEVEAEIEYQRLKEEAINIINQNVQAFTKLSQDPKAIAAIERSLNLIEMFLYGQMAEANMFGSNKSVQGL